MTRDIMDFIEYIHNEKQTSKNTEVSYERDLRKLNEYLAGQNICDAAAVTETTSDCFEKYSINEGFFSFP